MVQFNDFGRCNDCGCMKNLYKGRCGRCWKTREEQSDEVKA